MTPDEWERAVAQYWERAASSEAPDVDEMDLLAAQCPIADGRGDYERGGARDSAGRTAEAIPLYERALTTGLDAERTPQARVQLASSLRAVGDSAAAIAVLEGADLAAFGGAPAVVLALALRDAGRSDEALRVAIEAVAPHLTRYRRSMTNYARLITEPE